MNDNFYLIPDATPSNWDASKWNDSDSSREDFDELNRLLVTNLGWFSLACSRALNIAREGKYREALRRIDEVRAGVISAGGWSDAHRNIEEAFYGYIIDWMVRAAPTELDLQKHIRGNLVDYIKGVIEVPIRSKNGQGMCDLLVRDQEGKEHPVEVKLGAFNNAAKRQLRRYMDFYSADHGYAIAASLKADLDPDMTFVPAGDWRSAA